MYIVLAGRHELAPLLAHLTPKIFRGGPLLLNPYRLSCQRRALPQTTTSPPASTTTIRARICSASTITRPATPDGISAGFMEGGSHPCSCRYKGSSSFKVWPSYRFQGMVERAQHFKASLMILVWPRTAIQNTTGEGSITAVTKEPYHPSYPSSNEGHFNYILQLPDVARPVVGLHQIQRLLPNRSDISSRTIGVTLCRHFAQFNAIS